MSLNLRSATTALGLAFLLGGCAILPHHTPRVAIRPVAPSAEQLGRPSDGPYQDALNALAGRDYARALDSLQVARQRKPDDPRVLNAFGVVYDKLGRFDLSLRYYEQARALDPGSQIVAGNLAYSAELQAAAKVELASAAAPAPQLHLAAALANPSSAGREIALQPRPPETAPAQAVANQGGVVVVTPGVVRLVLPPASTPPSGRGAVMLAARGPGLTGRPLEVVNASGRVEAATAIRGALADRGWTVAKAGPAGSKTQPQTEIRYAVADLDVARALARTLTVPARLAPCDSCAGVRLVIGSNAIGHASPRRSIGSAGGA